MQHPLAIVVTSVVILTQTFIRCIIADLVPVDLLGITRLTIFQKLRGPLAFSSIPFLL